MIQPEDFILIQYIRSFGNTIGGGCQPRKSVSYSITYGSDFPLKGNWVIISRVSRSFNFGIRVLDNLKVRITETKTVRVL